MPASLLNIGLVQFDIAWENPDENMRRIEKLLGQSSDLDLVILPEMWSTGFTMQPEKVAEPTPGTALQWMSIQAKERNTAIAGSVSVADGAQYYNRWYCTFPDGRTVHYDKKHLFSYGREDQHYTAGSAKTFIEIKGWKIMPIICYDLRFPVWCRNTDSYDLMMVVANWPVARIHHWDALLKARAIENQSYVAAVNRIGSDANGLHYNGHSSVFDMNGQEVLSLGEIEGLGKLVLDKQILMTYRDQFRFLQDQDPFTL
jgi:omega-amidase